MPVTHSYYINELMLFHDLRKLISGCGSVFIMKGEPKIKNFLCVEKKVGGEHSGPRGC